MPAPILRCVLQQQQQQQQQQVQVQIVACMRALLQVATSCSDELPVRSAERNTAAGARDEFVDCALRGGRSGLCDKREGRRAHLLRMYSSSSSSVASAWICCSPRPPFCCSSISRA
jgi:hypothetical protein